MPSRSWPFSLLRVCKKSEPLRCSHMAKAPLKSSAEAISLNCFRVGHLRCSFWSSCFQVEGVHVHVYVRCCAELTLSPSIYCRLPLVLFHRALDHCPLTHRGFEHTLVGPQVDLDASVRVRVALLCMMSQPCVASCKCRVVSCCFRALPCARAHPDLIEVIS